MKRILLTGGGVTLVDNEDYDFLNKFKWGIVQKSPTKSRYVVKTTTMSNGQRFNLYMARFILGLQFGDSRQADHINHDSLDNRKKNLRVCTPAQNLANRSGWGYTSQYKGVCWHKAAQKWRAQIKHNGYTEHLGCFDDEIDAAKTYDDKAKELFGKFTRLNFPV